MIAYKKILIPVDFSEHSEFAVKKGISLAQVYRAKLYFLHIGKDAAQSAEDLSTFLTKVNTERFTNLKKLVAQGNPSMVIPSVAKRTGVDAILMGTRGTTGIKHLVQGSVAEKVLRESPCPVFMIKKRKQTDVSSYMLPQIRDVESAFQIDKILVALDFSPASKLAMRHAMSIASLYSSTIYTLTVFDKKFKEYGDDRQKHTSIIVRGKKIRLWERFPELLHSIDSDFEVSRLKRMLLSGDPASRIESLVDKKDIDLVVMGTNGKSGFEQFLGVGSVAEKVLRSVDCAVMTIRSTT